MKRRIFIAAALVILATSLAWVAEPGDATIYLRGRASPDGIGKSYMGREIALVMGHLGAPWLENAPNASRKKGRSC